MSKNNNAINVQAHLHHQYFLGLQLMVAVEKGPSVVGDWIFRLFRKQHNEKFLSSFEKLGLAELPHAVACAKYHVLSNNVGGVGVEFMAETEKKAWLRFRYPRWMYDGPAICGIPVEASRGFLKGWYAQNGVTLKNPRLGFVCVSEDLTGQFGFCGYFKEYDRELSDNERLIFSPKERPPNFNPNEQPLPPDRHWTKERLDKAKRNYAVEFCRNGIIELANTIGESETLDIGKRAARLTGLQQYQRMAEELNCKDGNLLDAAQFLSSVFSGMGDNIKTTTNNNNITINQSPLRIVRDIKGVERNIILEIWVELWTGCVMSHRRFMNLSAKLHHDELIWSLSDNAE